MDITYHIEVDEAADGRGKDFLASFIHSKSKARSLLREHRKRNPAAYLVKCVQTRRRDGEVSSPVKKGR